MERFASRLRKWVIVFCAVLFFAGAIWNLFFPMEEQNFEEQTLQEERVQEEAIQEERIQEENVDVMFSQTDRNLQTEVSTETLENRIAALRIERDSSYQQLYHALELQDSTENQQLLQTYAELQYKEHRLEVLLSAKGIDTCLVVLEAEQANVIVPEEFLHEEYEKLYDLVLRNTEYTVEQIILIPLKD